MTTQQTLDGLVLLDKPIGISSNRALQQVKRLFQAKKAGHTGSLDPLATGMLPILFGKATKLSRFLLGADKCYQVTAKLGIQTSTGDAEGDVIASQAVKHYAAAELAAVLNRFTGQIQQIPPMYSALKHKGKPLYAYARQGIEIPREPRSIMINKLEQQNYQNDELQLTVHCGSGTYIRTLVEDIGQALGCGAHVIALRRMYVEPYSQASMYTYAELEKSASQKQLLAHLLSVDENKFNGFCKAVK